jgi:preprotein translocase subunit YajC
MAPPPGQAQPNPWLQFGVLGLFFLAMYFLMIHPVRKRQKQTQTMLESLKAGDKVVTSGGLLGTIAAIEGGKIQLRIADNVKVQVTKSSVVGLQDPDAASPGA